MIDLRDWKIHLEVQSKREAKTKAIELNKLKDGYRYLPVKFYKYLIVKRQVRPQKAEKLW